MLLVLLTLACIGVGVWCVAASAVFMAWILFVVAAICLLHVVEWLVKDS